MSNQQITEIKKNNIIYLFNHYITVIKDNEEYINSQQCATTTTDMIVLCKQAINQYDEFQRIDADNSKVNRWLGYIQGILITIGLVTIEGQRDFTRSYLTEHRSLLIESTDDDSTSANARFKQWETVTTADKHGLLSAAACLDGHSKPSHI